MNDSLPNNNFGGIEYPFFSKEKSLFRVLSIPYESTTTYRPGTRFGPQAIIEASKNMELYDEELRFEAYKKGIYTCPFIEPVTSGPEQMCETISKIAGKMIDKNKILISLGGEHSVSIGLVNAFVKKYPSLSVLHLDAHADLRNSYQDSPFSHACAARRISEKTKIVSAGIRSLSKEEADFISAKKYPVFWGKEAIGKVDEIISMLSDTVYITLDVDILDPSIMPATGTPEPYGWLWEELTEFLKNIILEKKIAGIDIVELSSIKDNPAPDFAIAKLIYRIMGYIINKGEKS